ncbi:MAG: phosphoribosylformylglycinamidine cyclo-ligase [Chlamydiota bacterium]
MNTVTYKDSGVDIDASNNLIKRLRASFPDIGGFGGLYPIGEQYLVAGCDGVGTKLKIAFGMNKHDTIGIDLVAMSVNDVLTTGAKPLFFLDYFATSSLDVNVAEQVLSGIAKGCRESGCILLGGETAEMPDFYQNGEYDLSGFCVGMVHHDDLINGENIQLGDKIVGLPSSGFHSNGFSLVRHVLKKNHMTLETPFPYNGEPIGQVLLTPTRIYVSEVMRIIDEFEVKGVAHITGGGLEENIPRIIPKDLGACLEKESWKIPTSFKWIQELSNINDKEMFRTFNMGIGMTIIMKPNEALCLTNRENDYVIIGEIVEGEGVQWQ